jgi:protein-S-isoprenylcysteine O-methyltransferase Ste14
MGPAGSKAVIVLSTVLGGGSLLFFSVFLWFGSFELVPLGFRPVGSLAWNAALSVVFFLQHSGMTRQGFRRRIEGVTSAELTAALYSIVSGVVLLLVLSLWQTSSTQIWTVPAPGRWLLRAAFLAAVVTFSIALRALRGFDGLGLRPIRDRLRGRTRPPVPLTVRGPYRWVRHPLYTCVLVMIWSCPDLSTDRLLFNLLWTGWIIVGSVLEERDLVREFADEYLAYRRRVPMLVPSSLRPRWPEG